MRNHTVRSLMIRNGFRTKVSKIILQIAIIFVETTQFFVAKFYWKLELSESFIKRVQHFYGVRRFCKKDPHPCCLYGEWVLL